MTSKQAYENFIIKINENASTDGVACDKGKFVKIFNTEQSKLIEYFLEKKFEDDIRYIQAILVDDKKLSSSNKHLDHIDYELPKDYFDFSNLYVIAKKDKCTDKVDCFEIKDDDRNLVLRDTNLQPSFKYRETPFHLSSNKIKIYLLDFEIEKAYLSYYRYPKQLSLVNNEDPESDFLENPEFDDKFVNRVIDLTVSNFFLNNDDQKFQAQKMQALQKP